MTNYPPQPEVRPPVELVERERWGRNIVRYNAMIGGVVVGNLELNYSPKQGEVIIDNVGLAEEVNGRPIRGQGYGRDMYALVPDLPLPDGSDFRNSGMKFVSSTMLSRGESRGTGEGLWQSLVRRGLAFRRDDGRYEYIVQPKD